MRLLQFMRGRLQKIAISKEVLANMVNKFLFPDAASVKKCEK